MNLLLTICGTLICCTYTIESARILGVFPAPSYSHYSLGSRLMTELAARGHDVTMISPFTQKPPLKNFRDVVLTGFAEEYEEQVKYFLQRIVGANFYLTEIFMNVMILNSTEEICSRPAVQELLKSNEKFDAVIVEEFYIHALQGFCHHFKAPCILFSSIGLSRMTSAQVGNPLTPSYIPDLSLPYGAMNFSQRLQNTVRYSFTELLKHLYVIPRHNQVLQKYFPGAPDMKKLYYNVSLVFINSHVSTHPSVPQVPNLIDIGGFHIKPPKKLPKDF